MENNDIKYKLELFVKVKNISGGERYEPINLSNITKEELMFKIFKGISENKKYMINITDFEHKFTDSITFESFKNK